MYTDGNPVYYNQQMSDKERDRTQGMGVNASEKGCVSTAAGISTYVSGPPLIPSRITYIQLLHSLLSIYLLGHYYHQQLQEQRFSDI